MVERSPEPFLDHPATGRFIQSVAKSTDLLIYIGAGVTKSQSGQDWAGLVSSLLREFPGTVPNRDRLQMLPPLQIASIVQELFNRRFPTTAETRLINRIRELLYVDEEWRRGYLAAAIAWLCIMTANDPKAQVAVTTTNYDQYFEEALDAVRDDAAHDVTVPEYEIQALRVEPMSASSGDEGAPDLNGELGTAETAPLVITHLHGLVGRDRDNADYAVFSEADYAASETVVADTLTAALQHRDVLIVGSSLDDPPLLRALLRTATDETAGQRWAIFPRQALDPRYRAYDEIGTANDLLSHFRRRMALFKVDLIIPDFFHQVAQGCFEIACARRSLTTGQAYEGYSQRIGTWWNDWYRSLGANHAAAQASMHDRLRTLIPALRTILEDDDEPLKLELWVRWLPSKRIRDLKLWASSTGTWLDESIMRTIPIENGSDFLAAQAFCLGSALIQVSEAPRERWVRYLAVPIRVGKEPDSIPVGSLVLSTNKESSELNNENGQALYQIVTMLQAEGRGLLTAP